jgi:hypothetical protein
LSELFVLVSFDESEDEDELPPDDDLGVEYDLVSLEVAGGGEETGLALPEDIRVFAEGAGTDPGEGEDGPIALGTVSVRLPGVLPLSSLPEDPLPGVGV